MATYPLTGLLCGRCRQTGITIEEGRYRRHERPTNTKAHVIRFGDPASYNRYDGHL